DQRALQATEKSAREALNFIGVPVDATAPPGVDPAFDVDEQANIRADSSQLLLILAEALAQPRPGQKPEELRASTKEALRLVTLAALCHPPIEAYQAYHLRRARYLDQFGKSAEAMAEAVEATRCRPATALDHFLVGDERYKHEELEQASQHFES